MNEKEKLFTLEKAYQQADKDLEKEKLKRNLILIGIYSVIIGYIVSRFIDPVNLLAVIEIIVIALISGVAMHFVTIIIFVFVTNYFTNIDALESRKKHLAEEIMRIQKNTLGDCDNLI